jgi:hypothetical protein
MNPYAPGLNNARTLKKYSAQVLLVEFMVNKHKSKRTGLIVHLQSLHVEIHLAIKYRLSQFPYPLEAEDEQ